MCSNTRNSWFRSVAGIVALIAGGADLQGQTRVAPRVLNDQLSCAKCRITFGSPITLEPVHDTLDPFPVAVRRDARGRYWLMRREGGPIVFDRLGRIEGVVGRPGRGPGEYLSADDVMPIGTDSVAVFDGLALRASILDNSLRYVRSVSLPFDVRNPVAVRWPREVVGTGAHATPDEAGWPLHTLSFATGRIAQVTRSFGAGNGELRPDGVLRSRYSLTAVREGSLWTAWTYGYELHQFTTEGKLLRSLVRRPSWFAEPSAVSLGTPTTPPPPFIAGVEEDSSGLLWVAVRVPSPGFRAAWPKMAPGTREVSSRSIAMHELHHTIIEVIDAVSNSIVARLKEEVFIVGTLPGPSAVFYKADDSGVGHISIAPLSLLGR